MSGPANPLAFPSVCLNDPGHPESVPGMTLRDWFAGQALIGTFQHETDKAIETMARMQQLESSNELRAQYVYEIADAMLAARATASLTQGDGHE